MEQRPRKKVEQAEIGIEVGKEDAKTYCRLRYLHIGNSGPDGKESIPQRS